MSHKKYSFGFDPELRRHYYNELPARIKKIHFDGSPYARVLILEHGYFFVQMLPNRYYRCNKLSEALALRQTISDSLKIGQK